MAETPKSPTSQYFYNILGLTKNASLKDICKAYKSLVMKWHPDRNSNKAEAEEKFRSITEAYRVLSNQKREESMVRIDEPKTPKMTSPKPDADEDGFVISSPKLLSRTTSRQVPLGSPISLSERRNSFPTPLDFYSGGSGFAASTPGSPLDHPSLSKAASRRSSSTPIIFSQSTARRKPPPVEKKLECTLEELNKGCVKKIKITRDVMTDFGLILKEDEVLKIKVKPGWKKGTKITFEGKGDERPGLVPADIMFVIDEKPHPLYKRRGDDLELGVQIPLVQALTGCTIDVPLLGGETMSLTTEEIIHPGYEKIIPGQGMLKNSKEDGTRGDLHLKFLVEFPTELSDEQRFTVFDILKDCSDCS